MIGVPQVRGATLECDNRGKAASATAKALEDLAKLRTTLAFADGATFESCIQEACGRFYALFRDKVLQLTHNFPEVMIESGGGLVDVCIFGVGVLVYVAVNRILGA